MTPDFSTRVARAVRVRGPGMREVYYRARRAARVFWDARRRQTLSSLGAPRFHIPREAGFLLLVLAE